MIKEFFIPDVKKIVELQGNFKDGWSEASFLSSIDCGLLRIFGIFDNDELVGFISLGMSDVVDVETIYVKEEYRRKGFALQLLNQAEKVAREILAESIMLEVRQSNFSAIKLYEKAGFTKISVRKNYYFDGENALVLKKEIKK